MSRRGYQLIALCTLPLPFLATYALGPRIGAWLPDLDLFRSGLVSLFGYLLLLFACVLVWGVALWPLRKRAGFTPLSEELRKVNEAGGLAKALDREQTTLKARATSEDPAERRSYHLTFGFVSLLFTGVGALLCWMLWTEGYVLYVAVVAVFACPVLALYHGVRWLLVKG